MVPTVGWSKTKTGGVKGKGAKGCKLLKYYVDNNFWLLSIFLHFPKVEVSLTLFWLCTVYK